MGLGELIEFLKKYPRETAVPVGFGNPHSYRGDYADLAFEPVKETTVGVMLDAAESAVDAIYEGWKGGDYQMRLYTDCWLAVRGCRGEGIGPVLLSYMVAKSAEQEEG